MVINLCVHDYVATLCTAVFQNLCEMYLAALSHGLKYPIINTTIYFASLPFLWDNTTLTFIYFEVIISTVSTVKT